MTMIYKYDCRLLCAVYTRVLRQIGKSQLGQLICKSSLILIVYMRLVAIYCAYRAKVRPPPSQQ